MSVASHFPYRKHTRPRSGHSSARPLPQCRIITGCERQPPRFADRCAGALALLMTTPIRAALALAASILATPLLHAEPIQDGQATGGSYTMRKQVIGAGEFSSAGSYRLTGTVGEVGAAESSSPRFQLIGGFHGPAGPGIDSIFCDGFEDPGCP